MAQIGHYHVVPELPHATTALIGVSIETKGMLITESFEKRLCLIGHVVDEIDIGSAEIVSKVALVPSAMEVTTDRKCM